MCCIGKDGAGDLWTSGAAGGSCGAGVDHGTAGADSSGRRWANVQAVGLEVDSGDSGGGEQEDGECSYCKCVGEGWQWRWNACWGLVLARGEDTVFGSGGLVTDMLAPGELDKVMAIEVAGAGTPRGQEPNAKGMEMVVGD